MSSSTQEQNKSSDFLQQRLRAWQPILTPRWVILSFILVGVIFVPIGLILNNESDQVVELSTKYDAGNGDGPCAIPSDYSGVPDVELSDGGRLASNGEVSFLSGGSKDCTITLTVKEKMEAPVFVYYELENFFQNHRRYVKSRSDAQLSGGTVESEGSLADCDPLITSKPPHGNFTTSELVLHPCGLIANSMFNDTFTFDSTVSGAISEKGIAWETDVKEKFKAVAPADRLAAQDSTLFLSQLYPGVFPEGQNNIENEHFIVWMRVAALPTFRKLYGKIDKTLEKGDTIQVAINSRFNVAAFDGSKSLVLSTTSFLGGRNPFLGIAYIVVGSICLLLAAAFFIKSVLQPRQPGETQYLQWTPARSS